MAANSLYPAFFRLFSQSAFAPHVSTHPTLAYTPVSGEDGTFENWESDNIDAGEMIEDFVDLLLPFYDATTEFLTAIIFTQGSAEAEPQPRRTISFTGKTGTSIAAVVPASMSQYTFRTDNFGLAKIVMLDAPVTTNFLPITSLSASVALGDLFDFLTDTTKAMAGRDNGRIDAFIRGTFKINDELRHQYRLD